jgi:hypothetical protein
MRHFYDVTWIRVGDTYTDSSYNVVTNKFNYNRTNGKALTCMWRCENNAEFTSTKLKYNVGYRHMGVPQNPLAKY